MENSGVLFAIFTMLSQDFKYDCSKWFSLFDRYFLVFSNQCRVNILGLIHNNIRIGCFNRLADTNVERYPVIEKKYSKPVTKIRIIIIIDQS